ncbi:CopG family transcriptional regulator [Corynebacterium cystitidis]|uniref:CopG family transcriptional regulator n=1 Tax=Corynebacterium cystitidis TaxID=35757 RepID=UPI00211ED246|nr:CopG family transcriptional regulator [Corynebacterium cystitidis]
MGINLRLTPEQDRQLTDLATVAGTSKQQIITGLIKKQWESNQARQVAARELDDIFASRSGLMERLKSA